MKDIVVMVVHTYRNLTAEQPPDVGRMQATDKVVIGDDSHQQLWTWFIENPRPGPARSSTRVARVNLAKLEVPGCTGNGWLQTNKSR